MSGKYGGLCVVHNSRVPVRGGGCEREKGKSFQHRPLHRAWAPLIVSGNVLWSRAQWPMTQGCAPHLCLSRGMVFVPEFMYALLHRHEEYMSYIFLNEKAI